MQWVAGRQPQKDRDWRAKRSQEEAESSVVYEEPIDIPLEDDDEDEMEEEENNVRLSSPGGSGER